MFSIKKSFYWVLYYRPPIEWLWDLNAFPLKQKYAGNACLLYQVNTLCIPMAVVYSNKTPREEEVCSVKVIRADEIANQKASIVHFAQRSLQIGIY